MDSNIYSRLAQVPFFYSLILTFIFQCKSFGMMSRECSWLDPSYQHHITFACTGCYQLHPPSPSRHYFPRLITGTNLPTPKEWIAWLAKADCTHITFAQGYYTIESKGTIRKWTLVVGSKTNSIPVNQHIIGRELNLRKLPGRQWESNTQPSEQLRPMTIKTSASTETVTTAYIHTSTQVHTQIHTYTYIHILTRTTHSYTHSYAPTYFHIHI